MAGGAGPGGPVTGPLSSGPLSSGAPGVWVEVRLLDPTGTDAEGNLILAGGAASLEWAPVAWLAKAACAHEETMCEWCRESWEYDHEVRGVPG